MKHPGVLPLVAALLGLLGVLVAPASARADEVIPSAIGCRWIVRPTLVDGNGAAFIQLTPERYILRPKAALAEPAPDGTGWNLTALSADPDPIEYDVADVATGKVVLHGTVVLPCVVVATAVEPPRPSPETSALEGPCKWGKRRGKCALNPLPFAVLGWLLSSAHLVVAANLLVEQERDPRQRGSFPTLPVAFAGVALGEALVGALFWSSWAHGAGVLRVAPSVAFTREDATVSLSGRF
jgi:hypothetical protein